MIPNQTIINKLISLEATATGLAKECREARKLIEGEVSTSPDNQVINMANHVARKKSGRMKAIIRHGK